MKCDLCGKNEAKYKYYEVDSNSIRELNICDECAQKKGIDFASRKAQVEQENIECHGCGLSFKEFKENNLLGCPECYNSFRSKLKIIFKQMHPDTIHTGKELIKDVRVLNMKKEIRELQQQLQNYVAKEKYEEAVQIRDKIEKCQLEIKSLKEKE